MVFQIRVHFNHVFSFVKSLSLIDTEVEVDCREKLMNLKVKRDLCGVSLIY